jgi:hypothetical protein
MPCLNNYDLAGDTWSQIVVHRFRNLTLLDGSEFRLPINAAGDSNTRHLARRRSIVLDVDNDFTTTDAVYASLRSRSANPWGMAYFSAPIRDGETVNIKARIYVKCFISDVLNGDNYRVTMRPFAAAASAGLFSIRVLKANGTSAATAYQYAMAPPEEGLGLRTAVGGGGIHIIEIEGSFTYAPGDGSTTSIGPRVYPQSDVPTYGRVKMLAGSTLDVERTSPYEVLPTETVS